MIPRWIIGVLINCTGSVAINLGVVLMKLSHKPHRSKEICSEYELLPLDGPVTSETGLRDRRTPDKQRRHTYHRSRESPDEIPVGDGGGGDRRKPDKQHHHTHRHSRESLDEITVGDGDSVSKSFSSMNNVWSEMLSGNKKYWYLGGGFFLLGTVINFFSMGYTPQSLLSSLGSVQFVSNCVFAKLILKEIVTTRIILGTVLILMGNCVNIMSSTHDSSAYSKADLVAFYDHEYQSFLLFELSFALGMHMLYTHYKLAKSRGTALYGANTVMPLSYAICSAIIGTQSAVQGKCLSELINMTMKGENQFLYPFSFFILAVWIASTAFWIIRMNRSLALFNGLFIIPTLQVCWTFFSVLGGGIYFNEFHNLSFGRKAMFAFGVCCIFYGVFMLAPQTQAELQAKHHSTGSTGSEDIVNNMEEGGKTRPRLASFSFLPVEITEDDVHGIETRIRSLSHRFSASRIPCADELGFDKLERDDSTMIQE